MNELNKYMTYVEGEYKGEIVLFSLSNCARCKKTKKTLNQMGVEYYYVDVDDANPEDRIKLMEIMEKWNPACIFPTVVLNKTCICGEPPQISRVLEEYIPVINQQ